MRWMPGKVQWYIVSQPVSVSVAHSGEHEKRTYESSTFCSPRLSTALISILSTSSSSPFLWLLPTPIVTLCVVEDGIEKKVWMIWSFEGSLKLRKAVDMVAMRDFGAENWDGFNDGLPVLPFSVKTPFHHSALHSSDGTGHAEARISSSVREHRRQICGQTCIPSHVGAFEGDTVSSSPQSNSHWSVKSRLKNAPAGWTITFAYYNLHE